MIKFLLVIYIIGWFVTYFSAGLLEKYTKAEIFKLAFGWPYFAYHRLFGKK